MSPLRPVLNLSTLYLCNRLPVALAGKKKQRVKMIATTMQCYCFFIETQTHEAMITNVVFFHPAPWVLGSLSNYQQTWSYSIHADSNNHVETIVLSFQIKKRKMKKERIRGLHLMKFLCCGDELKIWESDEEEEVIAEPPRVHYYDRS